MLLNKDNVIKLADFGIAKVLSDTVARTRVGTLGYMSPELERAGSEEESTYTFNTDVWFENLNIFLSLNN